MFPGEQLFDGVRPTKYVFKKDESSKFLVVVFSGFPYPGGNPTYNYIKTLEGVSCNKLFVLDDQNTMHSSGATYYLGENRDDSIEKSVVELISFISEQNGIDKSNIILAGSSKGGFASVYLGIKYCYGYVISGGPQSKLGHYLIEHSKVKDVAVFIAGNAEQGGREYLDRVMFEVVNYAERFPKLYIHVGQGDHHYPNHVIPLQDALDKKGAIYELDIGEYKEHSELAKYFAEYFVKRMSSIITGSTT